MDFALSNRPPNSMQGHNNGSLTHSLTHPATASPCCRRAGAQFYFYLYLFLHTYRRAGALRRRRVRAAQGVPAVLKINATTHRATTHTHVCVYMHASRRAGAYEPSFSTASHSPAYLCAHTGEPGPGGAGVSAVLVEATKFYYTYGVVPGGGEHGLQQVRFPLCTV